MVGLLPRKLTQRNFVFAANLALVLALIMTTILPAVAFAQAPAQADLDIGKFADPESVTTGDQLRYTIIVINRGPATATGVRL